MNLCVLIYRSNPTLNGNREKEARRGISGVIITPDDDPTEKTRLGKILSSPERWEAKQLIASGVLDVSDYPNYDEELGLMGDIEEVCTLPFNPKSSIMNRELTDRTLLISSK